MQMYELSAHAERMLAIRQIDRAWMEQVLDSPERTERHDLDPELRHAIGRVAACGDRYLRVVYNASVTPIRVVTVYFDRGLKGEP
ncbi:MAG: DUF4258 domain-containing protein [Burkholderiales bacterium]